MNYLENYIANSQVKQVNTTTQATENKTDKVNKVSFKGGKKKIALALAGMAAIGIAGVLIYKRISIPKKLLSESNALQDEAMNILKESNAVSEEASTILTLQDEAMNILKESNAVSEEASKILADAQKLVKETTLKIKEALKSSPEKIKEENGQKVFEELQEGILKRKSLFTLRNNEVYLDSIETYKENGLKDIIGLENNSIKKVLVGVKKLADGTMETAKRFFFKDGKLKAAEMGFKRLTDGTMEWVKDFSFEDGKLSQVAMGSVLGPINSANVVDKSDKVFSFEDGKLLECLNNVTY